jgi:hypothetical protein
MEELGKRVDVVEEHIRTLREELNRRFDQLAVMIKSHIPATGTQGALSKEEEEKRKQANLEAKLQQKRAAGHKKTVGDASESEVEDLHEDDDLFEQPKKHFGYGKDTYKVKAEIPSFSGSVDIEEFLNWLYEVETFFEIMDISQDRKVPLVAYKLKGGVGAWWHRHQEERRLRGEPRIRYWHQMKTLLKARFLPADYEQILFTEF